MVESLKGHKELTLRETGQYRKEGQKQTQEHRQRGEYTVVETFPGQVEKRHDEKSDSGCRTVKQQHNKHHSCTTETQRTIS